MSLMTVRKKVYGPSDEDRGPSLQCSAHGCPLRWSVDGGNGQLCSYHAWEPATKWPHITEELRRIGAWDLSPKRAVDTRSYPGHPKAWAFRLRDRHAAGEKLTRIQVEMYEQALRLESKAEA